MYIHDALTDRIIGCAISVHKTLGPGLMEATYEEALCVERLIGVHQAQVLAYMRVLNVPVGLLVNFNGEVLRTGIKRLVI
jgi:hypothetical protein